MADKTVISFYADTDIKSILTQWAEEQDRSVSKVICRLVEAERQRQEEQGAPNPNGNSKAEVLVTTT